MLCGIFEKTAPLEKPARIALATRHRFSRLAHCPRRAGVKTSTSPYYVFSIIGQVCPTDKTDKICQAFNVRKYSICDGPVFFKWENKNLSKWYVRTIIFFIQSHYIVRKLFTSNHFCVSICDELSDTCLCITGNLSGSLLCFLIC